MDADLKAMHERRLQHLARQRSDAPPACPTCGLVGGGGCSQCDTAAAPWYSTGAEARAAVNEVWYAIRLAVCQGQRDGDLSELPRLLARLEAHLARGEAPDVPTRDPLSGYVEHYEKHGR